MPKWIPLFRPSQNSHAPCPQIPHCQTGWSADQLGHPFSCKSVFTCTICKITKNFPELTPDSFPTDQGKPKPVVSWLKDGQPLDTKRVNIRNSDKDSILFIRTSQREDSGVYEITVKVDSFEDKATITLQIVGEPHLHVYIQAQVHRCVFVYTLYVITDHILIATRLSYHFDLCWECKLFFKKFTGDDFLPDLPGPPTGVKLVDVWGFNAALEWTTPKDNGNTEITGYTVQKADRKTGVCQKVTRQYIQPIVLSLTK